jgi:three-Cys-motif partner protein
LIALQELRGFCDKYGRAQDLDIRLVFNDVSRSNIRKLEAALHEVHCQKACCRVECSASEFREALKAQLSSMRRPDAANLVIMDQFGLKEVTPEVVRRMAGCGTTDILFFSSSSVLWRFSEVPELREKFPLDMDELQRGGYTSVHRSICDHYRRGLEDVAYHLAPFSIKKGSNIYGVIFGSSSLLGLEKFLKVCWSLDPSTGEANYNIDSDVGWGPQPPLLAEFAQVSKVTRFQRELAEFVSTTAPDNHQVYEFCLTRGMLPNHGRMALAEMLRSQKIVIRNLDPSRPGTGHASYLTWKEYNTGRPRVRFASRRTL